MRILFLGTPEFAATSLRRLVEGSRSAKGAAKKTADGVDYEVVAVVTTPDKPAGRGQKLQQSEVKKYALEAGLPVLQPEKLRDPEFLEAIRTLKPDLGIVIAFRMLPEAVWSLPRLGTFNLHASLLPQYRGAAPINRAIMNGEKRTGLTTFMLDAQIDTGAILGQVEMEIGATETAGELHDMMMVRGAELVVETVGRIASGTAVALPQPVVEPEKLKTAPKIFKDDCRIDWNWPGAKIVDHIRGLAPYPGAFYEVENGTAMKVFAARFSVSEPAGLAMKCADGWIEVLELQPAGKRRMTAREYLNGVR